MSLVLQKPTTVQAYAFCLKDWLHTPTMSQFSSSHLHVTSLTDVCTLHWCVVLESNMLDISYATLIWLVNCINTPLLLLDNEVTATCIMSFACHSYWTAHIYFFITTLHTMSSDIVFEEKLTLLVKHNPPIYDKNDRAYKKRGPGGIVGNIWQNIYSISKIPRMVCSRPLF